LLSGCNGANVLLQLDEQGHSACICFHPESELNK